MAHVIIADKCAACGACAATCPAEAIVMDEAKGVYVITDECVDCGACEGICPTDAIVAE